MINKPSIQQFRFVLRRDACQPLRGWLRSMIGLALALTGDPCPLALSTPDSKQTGITFTIIKSRKLRSPLKGIVAV